MSTDALSSSGIVLFMVDQLSAKWLEAASAGVVPTPNLDRLRARGTTFTQCITSNPVCQPTRSTLATGLTTRGHGVLENGYQLDPALPTFMRGLQKSGWRTAALGKVHLRPHFAGLHPDYRPYGFDLVHNTEDGRGGEWLDWVAERHPEHLDAVLSTIWAHSIPEFAAYGPDRADLRARIKSLRSKAAWATPDLPEATPLYYALPFPDEVSQTSWITGHTLDFIEEVRAGRPFFAQVSYVQPHSPSCPPGEYIGRVDAARIPTPAPAEWLRDPHAPGYFAGREPALPETWRPARQCYFADIAHLDHQLGRVLDALEQAGRLDQTSILFLSDHGDLLCDHGFLGKEERHYDACIRVPLIIAGPGVERGQVRRELVQLEDICPTILDMAGLSPEPMPRAGPYLEEPAGGIPVLPGRSLLPLCRGQQPPDWRGAAYCESYNSIVSAELGDWARTIRTADFRYTFYAGGNGEQMFDLRSDPDEQANVVADPAYAGTRQQLRDQLMDLIVLQDYPKTRRDLFALGVH